MEVVIFLKKFAFFIIFLLIILLFVFNGKKNVYSLLDSIEGEYISVDNYYIYGTHLNMEGKSEIINSNSKLVFKSLTNEIEFDYRYDNGNYIISDYINDGIYLDAIPIDTYLVFFKVTDGDDIKYYSVSNNTNYNDTNYFTITRDGKNNSINILFSEYKGKKYMKVDVSNVVLSDNYYDIVIDPGHGGDDPGASFSNNNEADLNLDCALKLKSKLEELGLRVVLTRDKDVSINTYGDNSRSSLPYESGAKYYISLHLNSTDDSMSYGGVEVYAPNNSDLGFASMLAKNIVLSADTNYSQNEAFNVSKGVYIRTFTKDDIEESVSNAKKNGYKPYPITTDTNYYFMIRETGGFITGAYVDGRDKDYFKNKYYDSNVGSESYLLELGYINYWGDLNNLVNNMDGYVDGIANSFKEKLGIK